MSPFADRPILHRSAGALLVMAGIAMLAMVASAAIKPRVDNPHGKFKEDCQLCHSSKAWKEVKVSPKFDHGKFGFPLSGAHATSACMSCHTALDFSQSKTQCASCHQDPHRGEMGTDCAHCHSARSFVDRGPMVRAHELTRFPLTGGHATIDCENCHKPAAQGQMQFVGTNADCYGCHKAQYETAPNHVSGGFSTQCQTCHTPISWTKGTGFDHTAVGFPLTGNHSTNVRACDDCHHGNYSNTSADCYSCHATSSPGYSTATPPHDPVSFPTNTASCINCHVQANATHVSWAGATSFDHTAAGFPLTGNHSTSVTQCDDCHHGTYSNTSKACETCHTTSTPGYNNPGAGAPAHNTTYFPYSKCTTCHTAAAASYTTWAGGTYTHSVMQLTNAHAGRQCEDCHKGNYTSVQFNCYSCHQNPNGASPGYVTATSPVHSPANFPTDNASCQNCHSTTAWSPSLWPANHSTTAFAAYFSGAHTTLACTDCHNASTWNVLGTSNNCYGCHQTDYAGTTNPKHDPTGFPTLGCTCHSLTAWSPANGFDHTAAGFPLNGSHSTAVRQCADCHAASGYAAGATSKDCFSCHQNSVPGYNNAGPGAPVHNAQYFPTSQCTTCHASAAASFTSWQGGTFPTHPATFPLTAGHAGRLCEDCHKGNYTSLVNNCYTCHQNSSPGYATATNPTHTPANFKTDNASCTGCHNTTAWSPSLFSHNSTAFGPYYTGAHLSLACTDCHNASTWNTLGTSNNCYACHQTDYAGTTNPKHDPVNFPTAGCTCHTTTAWSPATGGFDHTAAGFPLTGNHALTVRVCGDCHSAGYTNTSPDCITCHLNSTPGYNTNAVILHTAPNFPTSTAQCITCHATANSTHTSWSGGTFANHAAVTTNFALNGGHGTVLCGQCHTAPTTNLALYTCAASCHTGNGDFNGHDNKTCGSVNFKTEKATGVMLGCYTCHPTGTSRSNC